MDPNLEVYTMIDGDFCPMYKASVQNPHDRVAISIANIPASRTEAESIARCYRAQVEHLPHDDVCFLLREKSKVV